MKNFLKTLINELGLDWDKIKKDLNTKKWKKVLNDNCDEMYSGNCFMSLVLKLLTQMAASLIMFGAKIECGF